MDRERLISLGARMEAQLRQFDSNDDDGNRRPLITAPGAALVGGAGYLAYKKRAQIGAAAGRGVDATKAAVGRAGNAVASGASAAGKSISSGASSAANAVKTGASQATNVVKSGASTAANAVKTGMPKLGAAAADAGKTGMFRGMRGAASGLNTAGNAAKRVAKKLPIGQSVAEGAGDLLKKGAKSLRKGSMQFFGSVDVDRIVELARRIERVRSL